MRRTALSDQETVTVDLEVTDRDLLIRFTGPGGKHLGALEKEYGISAGLRGNHLLLRGAPADVAEAERGIAEVLGQLSRGNGLTQRDVVRAIRTLRKNPGVKLADYMDEPILVAARRTIVPKGLAQHDYVDAMRKHDVVFGIGPAGTGKTYLAMAMAVRALSENRVKRIILTRPAVEAGEKLGFLPGDLAEKVNPYLRPLYDALYDMLELSKVQRLIGESAIEIAPLAFMRGRTLNDAFVILDEAQNSTREQMRMFLTRLGYNTKTVVTGDITQTDLPDPERSGLAHAARILSDIKDVAVCYFSAEDVVRHPLVMRIVNAYDRDDVRAGLSRERRNRPPLRGDEESDDETVAPGAETLSFPLELEER